MKVCLLIYRECIAECVIEDVIGVFSSWDKASEALWSDVENIGWREPEDYIIREVNVDEIIEY